MAYGVSFTIHHSPFTINKMALFSDINDLKTHIGGAYTAFVKLASVAPFFEDAVNDHILPRIDSQTVDLLRGADLVGKRAIAAGIFKSSVAWFGVNDYMAFGGVVMTENGLMRIETDTYKTAFKYQDARYESRAIVKAWSNFDLLLKILFENPTDFPDYAASDEAALNLSHFLNFTHDFRVAGTPVPDRYTLESLFPYISDIETFMVVPFLGETLHNSLLSKLYSNSETDLAKKQAEMSLVKLLRQGIAGMTYHLATIGNVIEFKGSRVLVRETSRDDAFDRTKTPSFDLLTANYNQKRDFANRYFQRAEMFIRDNAAYFPEWVGFTEGVDVNVLTDAEKMNVRLKML